MRVKTKRGSAREIELERFGLDHSPPPPFHPEKPGDWVGKVLAAAGMEDRLWERKLASSWSEIVGDQLAAHTRPGRYAHRRLTIYVDSSPWLSALQREFSGLLLEKLQTAFGAERINRLNFCLDPGEN